MEYGQLYIIPNDEFFNGNVFHRKVKFSHLMDIQEFSNKYNLGYQFKEHEY